MTRRRSSFTSTGTESAREPACPVPHGLAVAETGRHPRLPHPSLRNSPTGRRHILKGDTAAFFKAVEHVIGKPRQAVEVNQDTEVAFRWERDE